MRLSRTDILRLPKVELHVHLDGCVRPDTMLELGSAAGVKLPADTADDLAAAMFVRRAPSLETYLERFDITLRVMQTRGALERIAHEFVVDSAADNIRYVEVRFCPALHTDSLTPSEAVEAVLRGLHAGERETGAAARLIICGLRTLPPAQSLDMARIAVAYRRDGVVAFDLAGGEATHPALDHARAFEHALGGGLSCTCHAGEGAGPESIRQAIDVGASRIGHGTRLHEDPELEAELIDSGITLEVCLTSNVHTNTVTSLAAHPVRRYVDRGAVVTLNTDSRLMDATTLTDELHAAHVELGFTRDELGRVMLHAARSAFLPAAEKGTLLERMSKELATV